MVSIMMRVKLKQDAGSRFFFSQDLAGERQRKIRKFWIQKIPNMEGQTACYSLQANSSVCNQPMAGRLHEARVWVWTMHAH